MKIVQNLVDKSKYSIKCPYAMKPTRIVIHETANNASAKNEIAYMRRNNNYTSFHFAVDDKEAVQGIPLDRNAFHAGDGNGKGNREGISIEICYSKSGGAKWRKSVDNAAELTAQLLKERGWGIDKVTKHQDYNGKYCPHRILDQYGWKNFLELVEDKMAPKKKSTFEIAKEVLAGKWGNGAERKKKLKAAGYDYAKVQAEVEKMIKSTTPAKKSNEQIAKEVLAGKWGNGTTRKKKLKEAGYNYATIQALVNKLSKK